MLADRRCVVKRLGGDVVAGRRARAARIIDVLMTVKRMDHVVVVVDDMASAKAFFLELGLEVVGGTAIEGPWVDRVNGIDNVQVDILMLRTPDGHGQVELTVFRNPPLIHRDPEVEPPNTLGLRSIMFEVDGIDDVVARLQRRGGELIGEIVQYEASYRLCYMRGPAGIIVALAETVG
jgi:catechol 2,3-dioxygenase-like lactoylglutathione lyase family enzyme